MKKIITTDKAPAAIGPYSQAVSAAGFLYISGQLPIDAASGRIVDGGAAEQTRKSLENMSAILTEAGCSFDDLVKTTVYLSNIEDFAAMNEVYAEFFTEGNYPARAAFEVARLPKDALVEIEAVATEVR